MRLSPFALVFLALSSPLLANPGPTDTDSPTPSITPTITASPSPTATVTPGPGSWALSMSNPLVYGIPGNSAIWTYTADQPWTQGQLVFSFPDGFDAPSGSLFYVQPSQSGKVTAYNVSGQAVSVTVQGLNQGDSLNFYYGYNASGFAVNTTISPQTNFQVFANPVSLTDQGGQVTPVSLPVIAIVTATVTPTATPTGTISPTATITPSITATFTITQTFTETPLGQAPAPGVLYTYPNPFDLRAHDKTTLRFAPVDSAEVQIFNLVGEPVRRLDAGDIHALQGWAIWHGEDDQLRLVAGGLYFARIKTPDGVLVRKFTVLH